MIDRIEEVVGELLDAGKFVVTLGGEHTVAVGSARAYREAHRTCRVLALDAHADLRDEYLDSHYNHACTLRRMLELCPVTQVGLRSAERRGARVHPRARAALLPAAGVRDADGRRRREVTERLSKDVYMTIDLDGLDPSQMAAVGTPEPGGLLLGRGGRAAGGGRGERRIVGFDVTELAPRLGPFACAQLAAKLTYRLIGLALAAGS